MLIENIYNLQRAGKAETIPFFQSCSWPGSILTAGGTLMQSFTVDAACSFVARYLSLTAYAAGLVVATVTPPLLIQVSDTGSGRTMFDNPQPIQNVCGGAVSPAGTGISPFILPEPWLIRGGSSVQISLTNLGAAAVVRVDISMSGFKVFGFPA